MICKPTHPIVVLGAGGQLGQEICKNLQSRALPFTRLALDITNRFTVLRQLRDLPASAVINAAAYTQVDFAEVDPDICYSVNAQAIYHLVEACRLLKCPLVQLSTDFVFGGDRTRQSPYSEDDLPKPLSVYGRSKLAGEQIAATWPAHFIIRTCGLYGGLSANAEAPSFAKTMLELAENHLSLRVVADQRCTPSYVPHIAQAILKLIQTEAYGTYHITNAGSTTWYEFASTIFQRQGLGVSVIPISSADWGAAAARPHYSVLSCSKYASVCGAPLPSWELALKEYLDYRNSI
ncbi:dTDP-4-dehydrorhamnose reductase [Lacipirellula parvula]|uniref:dTDP-4-dehydrorhamnose reductase n=2 Tax=Lacipirellula parvula TaxID=2650471 RepID=A0A5K7XDF8_9BACT|nr:dTDP-4-dehydrorhamnose reductase [Lacipirellula parvula]